jgi:hypothetical protein
MGMIKVTSPETLKSPRELHISCQKLNGIANVWTHSSHLATDSYTFPTEHIDRSLASACFQDDYMDQYTHTNGRWV